MNRKIIFFLSVIFFISLFFTGFASSAQQEEFSFSAFSHTYGKSLGELTYNSLFDFNRNNSIDNEDLKVYISNTPLKSLLPFLSVPKKLDSGKKKAKEDSSSKSGEEEDPLDIDKDGDVDEQDVNLMKNLLTSTQMISSFFNLTTMNMTITTKPHDNTPTLASFYAYIGYTPEVSSDVNFLSLTLDATTQLDNNEQDQKPDLKSRPEESNLIESTSISSNMLLLSMQNLKNLVNTQNANEAPSVLVGATPDKHESIKSENIQQINTQTSEKQLLMSDKQQKKRTLQHLSTSTPIMVDQNTRNKHYDKSVENKDLELLKK